MKNMKNLLATITLSLGALAAFAQEPLDGAYQKVVTKEKEVIPYDFIREADVFWSKRIWRSIDVREKMNLPFKYPQQYLIEIIHSAAKNGELTVYDNSVVDGDQFKQVLPVEDVKKIGYKEDTVTQINPVTMEEETKVVKNELAWDKIIKFRLKEDWVFNENTSTMVCRIVGLAPVRELVLSDGTVAGDEVMYWVYYPDLRPILAKYEVFNPKNDAVRLSWEDLFEARMFESYIYKESNVYDRNIKEYATGIDQLLESERIKQNMFEFEHDLWNY
ncbi:MAG: gliding motility protein GldN [Chitinophagales bacterium]|jgi:gliding motility associated protien GldN|nr:gliding motility protein GldN [Chitinophagales bacterium]